MVRKVTFAEEARTNLKVGVDTLANAVKVTLGPKGRNVIIDKNFITPHLTKDGVTVAHEVILEDRVENIGATMVKNIARKTADEAGDGTTTATVLAQAIYTKGLETLNKNVNPIDLKKGMDKAVSKITEYIKNIAIEVTDLSEVATISANGDSEIGDLIAEIINTIGKDGVVTVEDSNTHETYYNLVNGQKYDSGYISPYFATDTNTQACELENPLVLVTNEKLTKWKPISKFADYCFRNNRSLLIICEEMVGEALAVTLANKTQKGFKVCVTSAPGFAGQRAALLEDIAISTGSKLVGETYGLPFHHIKDVSQVLGGAKKIIVDRSGTIILDGNVEDSVIKSRIKDIESHMNLEDNKKVKEKFASRIASLSGGVAVLRVGGFSEVEVKEKKDRIDDAICAVQASLEEGIVRGGGFTYLDALDNITPPEFPSNDEKIGYNIIVESVKVPFECICKNSGKVPSEILSDCDENTGYNFRTENHENLITNGVVDPAKVTRVALENAVSIAGLLLTTECIIYNKLTDLDIAMLAKGQQMNQMQ